MKEAYSAAEGRMGRVVVIRLKPGADLLGGMQEACEQYGIHNGVILSAIGSLDGAKYCDIIDLPTKAGAYAANNQRQLEREGDQEVLAKWEQGGMTVSYLSDEAVQDFKDAAAGVPAKFVQTCVGLGFDQAEVEQIVSIFVED